MFLRGPSHYLRGHDPSEKDRCTAAVLPHFCGDKLVWESEWVCGFPLMLKNVQ